MRISLNWLKDYLDIKSDITINDISASLTLAGLEVEGVHHLRVFSEKLLMGEVNNIRTHEKEWIYSIISDGKSISLSGPASFIAIGMVVAWKPSENKKRSSEIKGALAVYSDLGFTQGQNEIIAFAKEQFEGGLPKNLA